MSLTIEPGDGWQAGLHTIPQVDHGLCCNFCTGCCGCLTECVQHGVLLNTMYSLLCHTPHNAYLDHTMKRRDTPAAPPSSGSGLQPLVNAVNICGTSCNKKKNKNKRKCAPVWATKVMSCLRMVARPQLVTCGVLSMSSETECCMSHRNASGMCSSGMDDDDAAEAEATDVDVDVDAADWLG